MTSLEKVVASVIGADSSEEISCIDRFLGDDAINLLCERLQHSFSDNKKKLVLRGNCIGAKGAASLSTLLKNKHNLQFVSLEWNQIGQPGAKSFANALLDNKSLLHLDLRNNGINNEGAIALANALSTNLSLKVLDLRWNQIEDNGALAFKEALIGRNPALSLLISGNSLTESTTKIIDDWTKLGKLTIHEPQIPQIPESNNQSHLFQNELLQKEIASLRQQCMSLQSVFADVQRQLDGSALRVTDLEQQLSREQYRFNHANESLNQANTRISSQVEEQKALCAAWEKERSEIKEELHRVVKVKNEEVKLISAERDGVREKLTACEDDNVRLRGQVDMMQQQYNADQVKLENEIRASLNRISDLTMQETKIKTENNSLKAANKRLSEKVAALTEELDNNNAEHEKILNRETERFHAELEKWKADSRLNTDRLNEKNAALVKEMGTLQSTLTHLKSTHSSEVMDLEQRHSDAMKSLRAEEKKRCEQTTADLKQRLDLMTMARTELEARWSALNTEMKGMRDEHRSHMDQLQNQLADMAADAQRQTSVNANLKVALSTAEAANKNLTFELDDFRKKFQSSNSQAEGWNKELQSLNHDKQLLQSKFDKLEQQYNTHLAARAHDFDTISKHVVRSVEKEMESLRLELKINNVKHH